MPKKYMSKENGNEVVAAGGLGSAILAALFIILLIGLLIWANVYVWGHVF